MIPRDPRPGIPADPLDAINMRLDLEAEEDRWAIVFTDRVGLDCAIAFGGNPPQSRPLTIDNGDALLMWTPELAKRQRARHDGGA